MLQVTSSIDLKLDLKIKAKDKIFEFLKQKSDENKARNLLHQRLLNGRVLLKPLITFATSKMYVKINSISKIKNANPLPASNRVNYTTNRALLTVKQWQ